MEVEEWEVIGLTIRSGLGEGVHSTTAACELQTITTLGDCGHLECSGAAKRPALMRLACAQPGGLQPRIDATRAHARSST